MSRKPTTRSDRLAMEMYLRDLLKKKDQRIAELEERLKKSLESNNNFLKQIMELEAQLIKERLKGENK